MPLLVIFSGFILITLVFFLILSREQKEKNELFSILAHKLRSPIAIIRWYTELLSDESTGNLSRQQKQYLSEINTADEKLNEAICLLTAYLQSQSNTLIVNPEKANLRYLIGPVVKKLQSRVKKHKFNLREIYPKEQEAVIQVDTKLLTMTLSSLIENVIKHNAENGNIDIEVAFLNKKALIKIIASAYCVPEQKSSRTLTNSVSFKNLDFDLHLVKSILKKIKADINLKPGKDERMTFSVILPI